MQKNSVLVVSCFIVFSAACGPPDVVVRGDFESDDGGWRAEYADYPPDVDEDNPELYSLESGLRDMPVSGGGSRGFLLAGTNRSDDLWMSLVQELTDLEPSSTYDARFEVSVVSSVPSGCAGVGGAPGEGLTLKAGGAPGPLTIITDSAALNILWSSPDKGNQSQAGPDSVLLGNMANGRLCGLDEEWVFLRRSGTLEVTSDDDGRMTVFFGTDSGFEGRSIFYYDEVRVELRLLR